VSNQPENSPENPVKELRRAFDDAFVQPRVTDVEDTTGVLLIRAGELRFAVRAPDIRSIQLCPEIVTLPASAPALLGVTTLRGVVVGVYGLAELMNGGRSDARWLVLCGDGTVGLAFDELAGHQRLATSRLQRPGRQEVQTIEYSGSAYVLVDVSAILQRITHQGDNE
jgi:chemotaxis signal transduction protein